MANSGSSILESLSDPLGGNKRTVQSTTVSAGALAPQAPFLHRLCDIPSGC